MTTLFEPAYAKLNLTLDVLGKRDDGYHDIRSIMQTISIRDDIEIDIDTGKPWAIECSREGIPLDERNLAWKAAKIRMELLSVSRSVSLPKQAWAAEVLMLRLFFVRSTVITESLFPSLH